jgi:undecaprenyl-diphosphatase
VSRRLRSWGRAARDRAWPYLERRALLLVLLISACGWAFAQLADETREGETRSFDAAVLLALRDPADPADPLGPGWVEEFGRDVTGLGGVGVLAALTLAVAGYLGLRGRRGSMWLVLVAVAGGQAASTLFKLGFDRPRPDLVPHGAVTYTSSFPAATR